MDKSYAIFWTIALLIGLCFAAWDYNDTRDMPKTQNITLSGSMETLAQAEGVVIQKDVLPTHRLEEGIRIEDESVEDDSSPTPSEQAIVDLAREKRLSISFDQAIGKNEVVRTYWLPVYGTRYFHEKEYEAPAYYSISSVVNSEVVLEKDTKKIIGDCLAVGIFGTLCGIVLEIAGMGLVIILMSVAIAINKIRGR